MPKWANPSGGVSGSFLLYHKLSSGGQKKPWNKSRISSDESDNFLIFFTSIFHLIFLILIHRYKYENTMVKMNVDSSNVCFLFWLGPRFQNWHRNLFLLIIVTFVFVGMGHLILGVGHEIVKGKPRVDCPLWFLLCRLNIFIKIKSMDFGCRIFNIWFIVNNLKSPFRFIYFYWSLLTKQFLQGETSIFACYHCFW